MTLKDSVDYHLILKQIKSVTEAESNLYANLSNICAVLNDHLRVLWVGFYLKDKDDLVLGPFQGPLSCTRIPFNKGVCGASYSEAKTYVVDDVHKFPGHIACSSLSNSEIVIPIKRDSEVLAVLDIDSTEYAYFNQNDKQGLEAICEYLSQIWR